MKEAIYDPAGAILPLPAFSDNYIWAIVRNGAAAVVDPGQAEPVQHWLEQQKLSLSAILLTHHHGDHVGGVLELLRKHQVTVYGPARETLPHCDRRLAQGDRLELPELGLNLSVLDVPGHTAGHIAYYGQAGPCARALFCGDTLFAGGCGRLFEGTPGQMLDSLEKFSSLPAETEIFCAHEYTLGNLRWALAVEPDNVRLQQWYMQAQQLREQGRPTLPSSIGKERDTNPFLRTRQVDVAKAAAKQTGHQLSTPVEIFAALREWKNDFK
ncbi:hypothetical protein HA402_010095 [Bradysia odoriphaga]|nr:hypothetical protein HA402_010095 [Bradysia odoriphaga]